MTWKALAFGAVVGFVLAFAPSCGPTVPKARCQPSNCDGCCDDQGECRSGTEVDACGELGTTCSVCSANKTCFDGACRGGPSSNADAGSDAGVDAGVSCGPTTCASGCCNPENGKCLPGNAADACGTGGGVCNTCADTQICSGGACSSECQGCRDAAGNCLAGDQLNACGAGGNVCSSCFNDQVCDNGQCKNTTCTASNCSGCCAGNTCIDPVTDAQCGISGTACQTCQGGRTCQNGACTGGTPDAGIPGTDGGFGTCGPSCTGCCGSLFGIPVCIPVEQTDAFSCGVGGAQCQVCFFGLGTCNAGVCSL